MEAELEKMIVDDKQMWRKLFDCVPYATAIAAVKAALLTFRAESMLNKDDQSYRRETLQRALLCRKIVQAPHCDKNDEINCKSPYRFIVFREENRYIDADIELVCPACVIDRKTNLTDCYDDYEYCDKCRICGTWPILFKYQQ